MRRQPWLRWVNRSTKLRVWMSRAACASRIWVHAAGEIHWSFSSKPLA